VVGASAVSDASVERLEVLLPGTPRLDPVEVARRAELVLLAVPDDALAGLISGLAAVGAWQPGQLVVHTSGRHGVAVLGPAAAAGAIGLAVHPAMTFTGTSLDLARLAGAVMAVTAPPAVLPIAQALVLEMGAEPVVVAEAAREAYHAALAHVANHLVTLVAQGLEVLGGAGVDLPARVLAPLAGAALDNALRLGDAALTGPVARGDIETVTAHLRVLDGSGVTGAAAAYRVLAAATADRALAAGTLAADVSARLRDLLTGPASGGAA
jgi:predicted short-subunit dehydrogenase-like oxidoreductase (DUF2520 family)